MIVGLSGYAGSGKDTVASVLAEFGFRRVAFGDLVRDVLVATDPRIGLRRRPLSLIVAHQGWDRAKRIPEVRRLLQRLGSEGVRDALGEDTWVDACMRHADSLLAAGLDVVVSDVRFPNEMAAVRARDGLVWRVERRGCVAAHGHLSDTALDDAEFDRVITNNSSVADLRRKVRRHWLAEGAGRVA